jgi:competence protein ComEC
MSLHEELRKIPFVKILIPFIVGIIFGKALSLSLYLLLFIIIPLFFISFLLELVRNPRYHTRWIQGLILRILLLLSGMLVIMQHQTRNAFESATIKSEYLLASINEKPEEKEKSFKVILKVHSINVSGKWQPCEALLLTYIRKNNKLSQLKIGDELICRNLFVPIKNTGNPDEFDLQWFWNNKKVYLSAFLDSTDYILTGKNIAPFIMSIANKCQDYLLSIYRKHKINGEEYAVLAALTLGSRESIDEPLMRAYSASGAMHVLSLSGLHVGIIYMAFNLLLSFLDKRRPLRLVKGIIIILFIWGFALVTGLTACMLRSAFMITFLTLAGCMNRSYNSLNILAASAFLLLVYDPFFLYDVGFQLSYLAVAGITLFYKPIYSSIGFDNYILDKSWAMICVSLAAQLATTPISLHYFHQFPNLFLLTNFIVIPLTTIILYLAIFLMMIASIPLIAGFTAYLLIWLVKMLNQSVIFVEHIPFSITGTLSVYNLDVILLYILLLCICLLLIQRKVFYWYSMLALLIVLMGKNIRQYCISTQQRVCIAYNIKGKTVYDFIKGRRNTLLADSLFLADPAKIKFSLSGHWNRLGIQETKYICLNSNYEKENSPLSYKEFAFGTIMEFEGIILFKPKKYMNQEYMKAKEKICTDYLLISGKYKPPKEKSNYFIETKNIIIDSSVPAYIATLWKRYSSEHKLKCLSTADRAVIIEL